jgi:hypothetical protein
MRWPRICFRKRRIVLGALCALSSSCNYIADRGIDALDPFRISAGLGSVVGVRFRNIGLVDSGLMVGLKPRSTALGWRYGVPLFFRKADKLMDADQAEIVKTTSITGLDYSQASYASARSSIAILPGLLTWADSTPSKYDWSVPEEGEDYDDRTWIWAPASFPRNRYAQIHAFDGEIEVGLLVYIETGTSLGELADFFLGFFFIDIAGDDERL